MNTEQLKVNAARQKVIIAVMPRIDAVDIASKMGIRTYPIVWTDRQ